MKNKWLSSNLIIKIMLFTLLFIPISVLVAVSSVLTYSLFTSPKNQIVDFISPISTLVIAFLTLAYVITTNRQLSTMRGQLTEMKKSRELISQPLPIVTPHSFHLEKPRFYFSPPEKEYSGPSRYRLDCTISNHSSSPAVNVHVCACINAGEKDDIHLLKSSANYFNVIPEKTTLKPNNSDFPHFLFVTDDEARLIDGLCSFDPRKSPELQICTVYKNILGASFYCKQRFTLVLKNEEQNEILKNWFSNVSTFKKVFKNEIDLLNQLRENNRSKWDEKFEELKSDYAGKIESDDQEIDWHYIPGFFKISNISQDEYKSAVNCSHYGQVIKPSHRCWAE